MKRLVLQHNTAPPAPLGLLADWAAARGVPLDIHRDDLGQHLGVQFHPETTIETVRSWAWADRGRVSDGEALLERGRHHAEPAAQAAFDLFDAFWERTRT